MMKLDFLQYEFLDTSVVVYLRFVVILVGAILLKHYISVFFTRVIYKIYKKFWLDFAGQQFKALLVKPIEGLVVTILFYVAFLQIDQVLSKIILLRHRSVTLKTGGEITTRLITLRDVVDQLFFFFLIFYLLWLISRFLDYLLIIFIHKAKENNDKERLQLLPLLKDVTKVLVWVSGLFIVLGVVFHVNIPTLIAGIGIGGLAIAFAAKDSIENLLASFMIMMDKPFTIGDWVKVNAAEGTVEKVGFRSTRIRALDDSLIVVPNKKLIDGNLENFSLRQTRRIDLVLKINFGLSVETVDALIRELQEQISRSPHSTRVPLVYVDGIEDPKINLVVVYYVRLDNTLSFEAIKESINLIIYKCLLRYSDSVEGGSGS